MFAPGRWNRQNARVVYSAASIESAVLEVVVHTGNSFLEQVTASGDYLLLAIDVPEFVSRERIRPSQLPSNWRESREITQHLGDEWLTRGAACLLEVPSNTVPGISNYLINPAHPDMEFLFPQPPVPWDFNAEFDTRSRLSVMEFTSVRQLVTAYGKKELFLCHAEKDSDSVAAPLSDAFLAYGISCWKRSAEILVGDSILEKVNEGLRIAKYFVALVSPEFLRNSERCNELATAIARRNKKQIRKIFPVIVHYPNELVDIESSIPLLVDTKTTVWNGNALSTANEIIRSMKAEMIPPSS
jgi:RES domain-containing protein